MSNRKKQLVSLMLMSLLAALSGCGKKEVVGPSVSLHEAAITGNLEAMRTYIEFGSNLNAPDLVGGSSPLNLAAIFGQTEVARVLIEAGAYVDSQNNKGSTPLHNAAFFCHPEIVKLLLANGADKDVKNDSGNNALESVAGAFDEVKGIYEQLQVTLGPLGLQLDYDQIKATRPKVAEMLQ